MSTFHAPAAARCAALLLAALLSACGGGGGGAQEPEPPPPGPSLPAGIATLGAAGGTVQGADGASLAVPAGALADAATFALATDGSDAPPLPPQARPLGSTWSATPHGALFATDATVRVPYDAAALRPGEEPVLLKGEPGGGWTVLRDVQAEGGFLVARVRSLSFFQPSGVPVGGYHLPSTPPAGEARFAMDLLNSNFATLAPTGANLQIRQQQDPAEPARVVIGYRIPAGAAVLTSACPAPQVLGTRIVYTPVMLYRIAGQPGSNRVLLDPRNAELQTLDDSVGGTDIGRETTHEIAVNVVNFPFSPLFGLQSTVPRPQLPPGGEREGTGVQIEFQLECRGPGAAVTVLPSPLQPLVIARGFEDSPVDVIEHPWPVVGQVGQQVQSGFRVRYDPLEWFLREDSGDVSWEGALPGSDSFAPLPAAGPATDAAGNLPPATRGYFGAPTFLVGRGTLADNGRQVRVRVCVRNRVNDIVRICTTSRPAPVTVVTQLQPPRFTLQPLSRTHQPGDLLDLMAGYEGLPTPQRVTWQVRSVTGTGWEDATTQGFVVQMEPGSPPEQRGRTRLLSRRPLEQGQAFQFRVTYTTTAGTAISDVANVTVATGQAAPTILVEPLDVQVAAGGAFSLVSAGSGGFPLSYQWSRDGVPLVGANGQVLTITGASAAVVGLYRLEVRNSAGRALSRQAQVSLVPSAPQGPQPPLILRPPQPATAAAGSSASFSVGLAANSLAPSYQWLRDGAPIAGATSATLNLAAVTAADQADYSVRVSNGAPGGPATSAAARLTVTEAPLGTVAPGISASPTGLTLQAGQTARFSVAATGSGPLAYQWQRDGFDLPGATGSMLELPNVGTAEVGAYRVVVRNSAGSATSAAAGLALEPPGLTLVGPASVRVQLGENARFTATVVATPAPSCQWQRDGSPIVGATSCSSYTSGATSAADNGAVFSLSASSGGRTATSSAAVLTVVSDVAPAWVQPPVDQTTVVGGSASFSALASGAPTPLYQWSLNGSRIADTLAPGGSAPFTVGSCTGSVRLGADGASVTLSALAARCAGATVSVLAGNAAGRTEPAAALLRLSDVPIPVITSPPQPQTVVAGHDAEFTVAASSAVAGGLGFQWEVDGARLNLPATAASVALSGSACAAARGYERNGATLRLRGLLPGCNGATIGVRAVDGAGASALASARLTVTPGGPVATLSPDTARATAGNAATDRVSFTARASSEFANVLGFTWQLNGTPLPSGINRFDVNGCTGVLVRGGAVQSAPVREATLQLQGLVEACDGAVLTVAADDLFGTSAPARATIFVAPPPSAPVITERPSIGSPVAEGGGISVTGAARGNPSPTLEWSLQPMGRPDLERTLAAGSFNADSPNVGAPCSGFATVLRSGERSTLLLSQLSRGCHLAVVRLTARNTQGSDAAETRLEVQPALAAPAITQRPVAVPMPAGGSTDLEATASGNPTAFSWTLGGTPVGSGPFSVGACSGTATASEPASGRARLALSGVALGCHGAVVAVVARNGAGSSGAASTTLTVQAPANAPVVTQQPAAASVAANGTAVFTAAASGTPAPSWAWVIELGGISHTVAGGSPGLVLGACSLQAAVNGSTLTLNGVSADCDGLVVAALATNTAGQAQSDPALLSVTAPVAPVITAQSPSLQVSEGQTASFSVTASGNALTYQWFRNAQETLDGMLPIAGATAASHTTGPTRLADDATVYIVLVCSGPQPGTLSVPPSCTLGNLMTLGVTPNGSSVGACFGGPTGWCFNQPSPHGNTLRALAHDPVRNRLFVAGVGGMLMDSDDLGSTWAVRFDAARQRWTDLARLPSGRLVAVHNRLFGDNPTPGGVFTSDDDGATWDQRLTAEALTSAAFKDDAVGVAVGQRVYRSIDGGDSWVEVLIPPAVYSVGSPLNRVAYAGNDTFVAVGEAGVVIRSTDGGATWSRAAAGGGSDFFSDVAFSGTGFGLLVPASGDVLRSADFGATWAAAGTGFTDARAAAFATGTTAVVLNQFGYSVRSTDAGATWSANDFRQDSGQQLWRMAFVSPTLGYAVGLYGAVLRTGDAGVTWRRITGGQLEHSAEALETSPDRSVTLGIANGSIRRSTDGGRSWAVTHAGAGSLSWGSNTVAMTVELFRGARFSTDAGLTWAGTRWTADAVYHGGAMASASTAIALGRAPANAALDTGGFVERTTDGGATWTRVALPLNDSRWLWAARFISPTVGFIGGSNAGLWRTLDGGATWQGINLPLRHATDSVQAIAAGPGGAVFVAGDSDLMRSTDNGASWTRVIDSSATGSLKGVAFEPGTQRGLAVGVGGVWRSTDGGLTWAHLDLPLDMLLLSAAWPAPGVALVGGEGGTLLRNTAGGQIAGAPTGPGPRVRAQATATQPASARGVAATRRAPVRRSGPAALAVPDPRRDFTAWTGRRRPPGQPAGPLARSMQ